MTKETRGIIRKIENHTSLHVDETDSTNNLMERLLEDNNLENGYVTISDYQSAGKGMLQNSWISTKGENLLFSMFLKHPNLAVDKQFFLSKSISLALCDVLSEYSDRNDVCIKWPNDLLSKNKKMAGILIKNSLKNTIVSQSIVGIGVNVNQVDFPEQISATSLRIGTGKTYDLNEILQKLLQSIDRRMDELNDKCYSAIDLDYHSKLHGFKEWTSYKKEGQTFDGRIVEVCNDGRVMIEKRDASIEKFEVKEISLNPA